MKRTEVAKDREKADGRRWFEKFVEVGQQVVSRAPFFFFCVLIIVVWAASYPFFHEVETWMAVIHTVASVISIVFLVLLQNSGRRAEEAAQEKLNVLADALSDLMESQAAHDPKLDAAIERLRSAVGLEEKH